MEASSSVIRLGAPCTSFPLTQYESLTSKSFRVSIWLPREAVMSCPFPPGLTRPTHKCEQLRSILLEIRLDYAARFDYLRCSPKPSQSWRPIAGTNDHRELTRLPLQDQFGLQDTRLQKHACSLKCLGNMSSLDSEHLAFDCLLIPAAPKIICSFVTDILYPNMAQISTVLHRERS